MKGYSANGYSDDTAKPMSVENADDGALMSDDANEFLIKSVCRSLFTL